MWLGACAARPTAFNAHNGSLARPQLSEAPRRSEAEVDRGLPDGLDTPPSRGLCPCTRLVGATHRHKPCAFGSGSAEPGSARDQTYGSLLMPVRARTPPRPMRFDGDVEREPRIAQASWHRSLHRLAFAAMAEMPGSRPPLWTGHVFLHTADLAASARFYEQIGMRSVAVMDKFAALEMRGGTHLAISFDPEQVAPGPVGT